MRLFLDLGHSKSKVKVGDKINDIYLEDILKIIEDFPLEDRTKHVACNCSGCINTALDGYYRHKIWKIRGEYETNEGKIRKVRQETN